MFPTEIDASNAIVSCFTEYEKPYNYDQLSSRMMQLIRSRYHGSMDSQCQVPTFQLDQLLEDLTLTFIVGKPFIESSSKFRKVFKFKKQELGVSQE